jgi:hypothetical protein
MKSAKDTPKYRASTTEPHALFEGRPDLFYADRAWRWDIPKAGYGAGTGAVLPQWPDYEEEIWDGPDGLLPADDQE